MYQSQFIEMFNKVTETKSLCEICRPKQWSTIPTKDFTEDGYLVYGANGIIGHYSEYNHESPTILMACRGASCGAINISKPYSYITGNAMCMDEIIPEVSFEYLSYFLSNYNYKTIITGGAQPQITYTNLKKVLVPIPPYEKQLKFALIYHQADKSKFSGLKSQFIEMFCSRDTTPVGNYIEDSYPGEWGTEDKDGDGVKVIRTTNFTNTGKLDLADVVTRSIIEKKIERKTIHKYDTILERSGGTTDNPVGRVVLFEEDDVYLCNNFTQVLRFKNIDPRFAFYSLFYFYQTNKTAIRAMGNKTTGIQNLNMSKYLEIGIPNASEDEQHKFVLIAQQADKSKFELKKSIAAIDKVIKSLINNI